ncbi:toll/interleukin-1 receptor domain-containing protein [Winogradskya humida]|nr:toll/interleukin-1 receptor domain-containing protein [Actinoplanes humidus]
MTDPALPARAESEWDVFLSYSRADELWVRKELYPALLSRFVDGRPPRIFLDLSPDGLRPGSNWLSGLAEAVQHSRFFVAVYSARYFASPMCRQELDWSMTVHPARGALLPVLLDSGDQVPFAYSSIHWLSVTTHDWLDRLCATIGLTGRRHRFGLRWGTGVPDTPVEHTLPEQRVELVGWSPGCGEEAVSLDAGPATEWLRGTLNMTTAGGIATFRDLSFSSPGTALHLTARYPGGDPVSGASFTVRGSAPEPAGVRPSVTDALWFFGDSRTVAFLSRGALTVRSAGGQCTRAGEFSDRPRIRARWSRYTAVACWSGRVLVVDLDGRSTAYRLGAGPAVPAALCPAGDLLYAGMWNGRIWALRPGSGEVTEVLRHDAGVQAMAYAGGQLLVVGFDGRATWLSTSGDPVARGTHDLERVVWAAHATPDCVLVVGAAKVHRIGVTGDGLISLPLLTTMTTGALTDGDLAVAYDRAGQGCRFDAELEVRGAFGAPAGARPVETDDSGDLVVTAHRDGSHALLIDHRVVHVNPHGPMAVSPDGARVALAGPGGVDVVEVADLGVPA